MNNKLYYIIINNENKTVIVTYKYTFKLFVSKINIMFT